MEQLRRLSVVFAAVLAASAVLPARENDPRPAGDLVREAVLARIGPVIDVEVTDLQLPSGAGLFTAVRLDPGARLGQPMRLVLTALGGTPVAASAVVHVVADRVVTGRAVPAGTTLTERDLQVSRGELSGTPIGPVVSLADAVGARTRRAVGAETALVSGDLILRRDVEPGDHVRAIATIGAVQVTGLFVAADGGRRGDLIRIVNPDTHRTLKARVTKTGMVEVINER